MVDELQNWGYVGNPMDFSIRQNSMFFLKSLLSSRNNNKMKLVLKTLNQKEHPWYNTDFECLV